MIPNDNSISREKNFLKFQTRLTAVYARFEAARVEEGGSAWISSIEKGIGLLLKKGSVKKQPAGVTIPTEGALL